MGLLGPLALGHPTIETVLMNPTDFVVCGKSLLAEDSHRAAPPGRAPQGRLPSLTRGTKLFALCSQMSDVEAGGATVFPDLGAAIWPKKVSVTLQGHTLMQASDLVPVPQCY